ncbi:MAG: cache domain-containing protein [Anaerolineae bacterium]
MPTLRHALRRSFPSTRLRTSDRAQDIVWKRPIRLGLQARITALTILGLSAVFVAMGFIGLRAQAASVQVALEQRLALAETVAAHVDYNIGHMLTELAAQAAKPGFDPSDADLEREKAALAHLYRSGMFTVDVFVADADGVVLAVEPDIPGLVGADLSKHPHVRRALDTGQPQVSGVIPDMAVPRPLVSLVVPVKNGLGEIVGLIGGALDPTSPAVSGFIGPMGLGETGYAQIVDEQGMVIASTAPGAAGAPSEHSDFMLALIQRGEPTISSDAFVTVKGKESHEVIAFAPISRLGWGIMVEQDRAETLAPIVRSRTQTTLAAIVALVVAVLFVWFATRRVTRPVLAIAGAARRVADGDLDTPLPEFGSDEIGRLGRDFETMREHLRKSRELLMRWNAELEQKVAQRTRQLTGLQEATRRLTADLSLEATLEAMVEESRQLFGADRCAVFVLNPGTDELSCLIRQGVAQDYVDAVCQNYMRMAGGVARAMAKPVLVADAQTDPRMAPVADLVRQEGFHSILILPLVHHGQVTGAFALYHDRVREYRPDEISLGEAFVAQAASAVTNAQLYEELQRRVDELERFNRLAVGRELKMVELKKRVRELEATREVHA